MTLDELSPQMKRLEGKIEAEAEAARNQGQVVGTRPGGVLVPAALALVGDASC